MAKKKVVVEQPPRAPNKGCYGRLKTLLIGLVGVAIVITIALQQPREKVEAGTTVPAAAVSLPTRAATNTAMPRLTRTRPATETPSVTRTATSTPSEAPAQRVRAVGADPGALTDALEKLPQAVVLDAPSVRAEHVIAVTHGVVGTPAQQRVGAFFAEPDRARRRALLGDDRATFGEVNVGPAQAGSAANAAAGIPQEQHQRQVARRPAGVIHQLAVGVFRHRFFAGDGLLAANAFETGGGGFIEQAGANGPVEKAADRFDVLIDAGGALNGGPLADHLRVFQQGIGLNGDQRARRAEVILHQAQDIAIGPGGRGDLSTQKEFDGFR